MRLSRARLWGIGIAAALAGAALVPLIAAATPQETTKFGSRLDLVIGYGLQRWGCSPGGGGRTTRPAC